MIHVTYHDARICESQWFGNVSCGTFFVDALAPLKVKVRHRNSMVQPSTTLEIGRRAKVTGVHHGGHGNRYAK